MDGNTIRFCATADTLTLYWDKPADAPADCRYEVRTEGQPPVTVPSTHCTLAGLSPGTQYALEVWLGDCLLGECRAATPPRLPRLDVTSFGAVGDGRTLNTEALQAAIDACGRNREVYIPAGVFRTGALRLHSDMNLYLAEGAVLQGSEDPADYAPRIWSRFEGIERECYQSLLNLGRLCHKDGPNCRHVRIYGRGTIRGGGRALAQATIQAERLRLQEYLKQNAALVARCENEDTIPGRARGRLINLSNCEDVRISGLTLENGPCWNVHMIYCRDIVTDHCTFRSENVWNGDGWDPDSSERCTLFACRFATGDDMVAIKSGKNPEGNRIGRPTRDIRIFDCSSELGHGIAIGSEMSGGVEQVQIWDCDIARSAYGIEIKSTPQRGGHVRGITVRDCRVPRVLIHAVPYNNDGVPAPHPPVFSDCSFTGLTLTGRALVDGAWQDVRPVEVEGFDEPGYEVSRVQFRDCTLPQSGSEPLLRRCREVTLAPARRKEAQK